MASNVDVALLVRRLCIGRRHRRLVRARLGPQRIRREADGRHEAEDEKLHRSPLDHRAVRLAVHRGYETVIEEFDGSSGVVGRVMRTRALTFVPDVSVDPDYLSAAGTVRAEISAPLIAEGELLGVVVGRQPNVDDIRGELEGVLFD